MKVVIQRVTNASVTVEEKIVGQIQKGLVVLLGISNEDTKETVDIALRKIVSMRIFSDEQDRMNVCLKDINGELLIVSQFTLFADCSNGNRPSFAGAGKPEHANTLYEYMIQEAKKLAIVVEHGVFGANMKVDLTNDGPVTIISEY